MNIQESLEHIVGAGNVFADQDPSSASTCKLSAAYTVTPVHEDQIAKLLLWATQNSVPLIPQGGGTKDALGQCSSPNPIIVSLVKLKGILYHSVGDLIVTVLPGTTLKELQETLAGKGQFLPLDPAWPEDSTLGGIAAANASGPKRALYGSVRDHLIASRVACPDGKIIRTGAKVVKNVAGYDMNKLFIGAMGTLGIFTELTFKIRPLPGFSGMLVLSIQTPDQLSGFQSLILNSHLEPCVLEFVDRTDVYKLLQVDESAVFIVFEDVEASVQFQLDWVLDCAQRLGLSVLQAYQGTILIEPVLAWLRGIVPHPKTEKMEKVGLKLLSAISEVPQLAFFMASQCRLLGQEIRFHGGLYTGISYASLAMGQLTDERIAEWIEDTRIHLSIHNGQAVVDYAPGRIRGKVSVWGPSTESLAVMQGIKRTFDPSGCLNPGRYAGGI